MSPLVFEVLINLKDVFNHYDYESEIATLNIVAGLAGKY